MGGSSPYDPPPRGLRVPCPLCKPFDREERRNSCRYRARPLCPQGLNPLDRSVQTARSFADGDDGSGGDIAIPIKLSITLASANSPASAGGKSLPKTGLMYPCVLPPSGFHRLTSRSQASICM